MKKGPLPKTVVEFYKNIFKTVMVNNSTNTNKTDNHHHLSF